MICRDSERTGTLSYFCAYVHNHDEVRCDQASSNIIHIAPQRHCYEYGRALDQERLCVCEAQEEECGRNGTEIQPSPRSEQMSQNRWLA